MQEVRREMPLSRHKLVHRRFERLPLGLHEPLVLARVAGAASRRDVLPGRHATCRARQDVVEGEIIRAVLIAAILADEVVPQEDIEPREGDPIRRPHVFA